MTVSMDELGSGQGLEVRGMLSELKIDEASQQRLFRILADSAPVGLYLDDTSGRAIYINPKCAELVGMPADHALEFNWIDALHPEDREHMVGAWKEAFTQSKPFHEEYRWVHADGTVVWTQGEVVPLLGEDGKAKLFVGSLTDITDRKEAEQKHRQLELQLAHAQKMESMGRMAGGVAHDFNNMLNVITGYTEMALANLPEDSEEAGFLKEVLLAAESSGELTRDLMDFSRREMLKSERFNLSEAVNDMINMLRHVLKPHTEVLWTSCSECLWVEMDHTHLNQILMNLCLNARDAMEEGGSVSIKTTRIPWARAAGVLEGRRPEGDCACLTFSDTGCGIDELTLQRIFEPFFTTKEKHQGTGLGLASVYGNVQQSGGHIHVSSTVGQGTTFRIYLPMASETAVQED